MRRNIKKHILPNEKNKMQTICMLFLHKGEVCADFNYSSIKLWKAGKAEKEKS